MKLSRMIVLLMLLLLCSLLIPVYAAQQAPVKFSIEREAVIPDTPAGKQMTDWLRVFASGNQESFTRFIAERFGKSLIAQDTVVDRADDRQGYISMLAVSKFAASKKIDAWKRLSYWRKQS